MTRWILTATCLLTMWFGGGAPAATPCVQERARIIVASMGAAYGSSPMWLSPNSTLSWAGSREPVSVTWIRDRAVSGLAVVSGRDRWSGARAQFGRAASTLKTRLERYQLGWTGIRPPDVTSADLRRFVFVPSNVWFPQPGCYEIVAQVGLVKSVFFLDVQQAR